jgi:hypothetical protein
LSHTRRTSPPELACCLEHATGQTPDKAVAAVAYCDERVDDSPPPLDIGARFESARAVSSAHGIHLVDWFMCDDQQFRSMRFSIGDVDEWWDVPSD